MQDKNKLLEMLNDIIEIARTKNNQLTMEEIKSFLKGISLEESQFNIVYDYLAANKITIKGYVNTSNEFLVTPKEENEEQEAVEKEVDQKNLEQDMEEKAFLEMYLEELEAVELLSDEEIDKLVVKLKEQDEIAKNKLVEHFLKDVVHIAQDNKNKGVTVADLIQEGNIGLLQAIDSYSNITTNLTLQEHVISEINNTILDVIRDQFNSKSFGNRIAEKLSTLNENIKELKEDLGKKPTIQELADYMEMSVEEIKDLIRMSKEEDLELDYSHHHHN